MLRVTVDYGELGLDITVPDDSTVIRPHRREAIDNAHRALSTALQEPTSGPALSELVGAGDSVAISVCDATRPQPRQLMLRALLDELQRLGAADDVTVLIATGTHRGSRQHELQSMLGAEVLRTCTVKNHDCQDETELTSLGVVAGDVPVALNRRWVEADVRITTGFVEPHFFAGFSGGPKMVAPGLAGLETVMALHNARRIGDPAATWGVVEGNPVHDAIRAAAATCPPDFSIDVLLDTNKRITHVFSGQLWPMHAAARSLARDVAMRAVPMSFDLVITTNSGYPLDQNLYQAVKGMSAAAEIVKQGGTVICAAECRDGLPLGGVYERLLSSAPSIEALNRQILDADAVIADQWQVQVQARIQQRARVLVKADGLNDEDIRRAHLEPLHDIDSFIQKARQAKPELTVAVLPAGPQTIAYIDETPRREHPHDS